MSKRFPVHTAGFKFGETGYTRAGTPRQPYFAPHRYETDQHLRHDEPRTRFDEREIPDNVKRDAMVATAAPRIPWDEFLSEHFRWLRGEHIGLIGPTGQGKTTMIFNLFPLHPFTVVFGTKPRDDTLDAFVKSGFERIERWRSEDPMHTPRRLLWPKPQSLSKMVPLQKQVFSDAVEDIFAEGHWDIIIDEGYYFDEVLKLGSLLRLMYTQVRSMGISLLLGTQRPAWVPVEVYDQSTHLFFWRDNDKRNLDRLREVSVIHQEAIREIVPNLEMHQVLYLNTRTGFMCRTRCPRADYVLAA